MNPTCPKCGGDVDIKDGWEMLGNSTLKNLHCGHCLVPLELNYDESWDGEEERQWFWLEER